MFHVFSVWDCVLYDSFEIMYNYFSFYKLSFYNFSHLVNGKNLWIVFFYHTNNNLDELRPTFALRTFTLRTVNLVNIFKKFANMVPYLNRLLLHELKSQKTIRNSVFGNTSKIRIVQNYAISVLFSSWIWKNHVFCYLFFWLVNCFYTLFSWILSLNFVFFSNRRNEKES